MALSLRRNKKTFMEKEDIQNAQAGAGSAKNENKDRNEQKNQFTNTEEGQKENNTLQAGLGRDRMAGIESLDGMSGRDDYSGGDSDDMTNQNTNETTAR
jgi:hypothetical protein